VQLTQSKYKCTLQSHSHLPSRITLKRQPSTTWPGHWPQIRCTGLCAVISPFQCQYNQSIAEYVKREMNRSGSIVSLKASGGSMNRKGFSASQLSRFKACGACDRCGAVTAEDIARAVSDCAAALKQFCAIPLDYCTNEAKEQRRKERNRRRYDRRLEKAGKQRKESSV